MVNVSVGKESQHVLAFDFAAIPLFVSIANGPNPKAAEFAVMTLANLAAEETQRALLAEVGLGLGWGWG